MARKKKNRQELVEEAVKAVQEAPARAYEVLPLVEEALRAPEDLRERLPLGEIAVGDKRRIKEFPVKIDYVDAMRAVIESAKGGLEHAIVETDAGEPYFSEKQGGYVAVAVRRRKILHVCSLYSFRIRRLPFRLGLCLERWDGGKWQRLDTAKNEKDLYALHGVTYAYRRSSFVINYAFAMKILHVHLSTEGDYVFPALEKTPEQTHCAAIARHRGPTW